MDILMPQLGETVTEGRISAWYKGVGERVAAGETLFEIETEKTSMEVPTSEGGMLAEIRVPAGTTVPVGTVVAVVSAAEASARTGNGAGAATDAPRGAAGALVAKPAAADPYRPVRTPTRNYGPATLPGGIKVTPAARRLAVESGVDLRTLQGSTPHGHITARDVEAALSSRGDAGSAKAAAPIAAEPIRTLFAHTPYEEVPLDAMRRTIARRLVEAKQNVPHFYLTGEVQLERLLQLRSEMNAAAKDASKLSITDWLIRAVALALQRVPEANAAWAGDALLRFRHSDVAVAVAVEGGLYTPVIRQAERKDLGTLSAEMKRLAERARAHALQPDEYRGGAITVSNLGMYAVRSFAAIVNPPQAAILAVGAAERRALEGPGGTVRFGSVMDLTLSCDHRVIDGHLGARLLAAIRTLLEAPGLLLG